MVRFIKALFAWKTVRRAGVYVYEENAVTGARRALAVMPGYSPVDLDWLDVGVGHPKINGRPAWRSAAGRSDGRYAQ